MTTARPLTIGILCHASLGGSGVVATELGMALAERGHQVHFFCAAEPARFEPGRPRVHLHEVHSAPTPLLRDGQYALALASKVATVGGKTRFDILHAHYAVPHATSAWLAREMLAEAAPVVLNTLHGTDVQGLGTEEAFLPVTRHAILQGDGMTVPSAHLRRALLEHFSMPSGTLVEVIPNFVDTQRFAPVATRTPERAQAFFPRHVGASGRPSAKWVMHSSNFRAVKRVEDVLEVFARVQAATPSLLLMVGDGPERARAEARVAALGLRDSVAFLGEQKEMPGLLQLSDVFLLPSETESFGLAALEALSCGVPVIATRAGGLPELVTPGQTGFLHAVGDVEGMARDCIRLLDDATLHKAMSLAARAQVEQRWKRGPLVTRYEDLYRDLLNRRTR